MFFDFDFHSQFSFNISLANFRRFRGHGNGNYRVIQVQSRALINQIAKLKLHLTKKKYIYMRFEQSIGMFKRRSKY